jgi:hypothetical protein
MWVTTMYHPNVIELLPLSTRQVEARPRSYIELNRLSKIDGNGRYLPGFADGIEKRVAEWFASGNTDPLVLTEKVAWNTEACAREWYQWHIDNAPWVTMSIEEVAD